MLFTLTCFNFSHLQSTLHLMQYNYGDIFSIAQNRFWTWFWCLLVLLLFFALPLPHWQNVTFEDFFHLGKQKNSRLGPDQVDGGTGHGDHAIFGQKLLNTQHSVSRCAHKTPTMKWANTLKASSKKFTEAERKHSLSQQCQLVHGYRWVPRTLT